MEERKLKILVEILGAYRRARNEYLFFCPYCDHHKPKLSINIEKNVYKCWVCDSRGNNIRRIVRRFGEYKHRQEWSRFEAQVDYSLLEDPFGEVVIPEEPVELPEDFISLANKDIPPTGFPARKYLKERGISKKEIIWWKIGYCFSGEYKNRIIIPSFNEEGKLNYFIARSYDDHYQRYKNPPADKDIVFNDLFVDWTSDVILVEGVFDAMRAGHNAIPLLGSTLREDSKLFSKVVKNDTPVYIALDPDAEKKSLEIIYKLLTYDVELYKIDIESYTDVAMMPRDEFVERKRNASRMTVEEYMVQRTKNA